MANGEEPFTATVVISAGGPAGPPGTAATVDAGTTTTGSPGTNAAVTNVGTTGAAVFNFTIPRGAAGADGAAGATGPAGPAGAGSGDVIGPGAVTVANHVVLWTDTTGTAIKDSGLTLAGANTGDQTITLTGDVTGTGTGSFAATIPNDTVTYAKMQNISTTDRILGRQSAGSGDTQEIVCTAAGRALIDDTAASDQRTTLGLGTLATQSGTFSGTHSGTSSGTNTGDQDLSGLQPLDSELSALAGLTSAADKVPYFTGSGTASVATFTSAGRALVDDADNTAQRTTLGLAIGTDVQAYDVQLDSLSTLSYSGNSLQVIRVNAGETAFELATPGGGGTVTTTGSPASGNLTAFSGSTSIVNTNLTGDVTTSGGVAATIANDAVTYAKMQNVSATDKVLGRSTAGSGDVEEISTTGSGNVARATSPTFVTPILGTPTSGTLTNCTFPTLNQNTSGSAASLSVSGQTGLMTVTGLTSTNRAKTVRDAADTILELGGSYTPTGTWTSLTMVTPVLGTPTSGTLTSCTGLPISTGVSGLGTGVATYLATPSSANLLAALTDETGTGACVFANTPTLVTPILGTPTSGTLTSCTGLPVSGITASTSTALGIGSIELGHATDTTVARASAGKITVEGVPVMLAAPRVTTISSNATWSPNADTDDIYEITGQTVAATTISNPSGTPVNGQKLIIRATGTAARALTWSGSKWRASSDLVLPTTTTTTKTLYCGFIYNTAGSGTWDMVSFIDNF